MMLCMPASDDELIAPSTPPRLPLVYQKPPVTSSPRSPSCSLLRQSLESVIEEVETVPNTTTESEPKNKEKRKAVGEVEDEVMEVRERIEANRVEIKRLNDSIAKLVAEIEAMSNGGPLFISGWRLR